MVFKVLIQLSFGFIHRADKQSVQRRPCSSNLYRFSTVSMNEERRRSKRKKDTLFYHDQKRRRRRKVSKREGSRCFRVPWEYIGRGVRSRDTLVEEDQAEKHPFHSPHQRRRWKKGRTFNRLRWRMVRSLFRRFPTVSWPFFLGLNNTTGNGAADLAGSLPSLSFSLYCIKRHSARSLLLSSTRKEEGEWKMDRRRGSRTREAGAECIKAGSEEGIHHMNLLKCNGGF